MCSLLNWGMRFRILVRGAAHLILFCLCLSSSVHPSVHPCIHPPIRPSVHFILPSPAEWGRSAYPAHMYHLTDTLTHTVTQSDFVIEKLQQRLCRSVAAKRSEARSCSDLLTWRLGLTSAWCLLSGPKPRRAAVDHSGGAAWWRASSPPTPNASAEAISQP